MDNFNEINSVIKANIKYRNFTEEEVINSRGRAEKASWRY